VLSAAWLGATCLHAAPAAGVAAKKAESTSSKPATSPSNRASLRGNTTPSSKEKTVHVLNRLAFGARPDDAKNVERLGLMRWIEAQLSPQTIDDSAIERRLAAFSTLRLSPSQLSLAYHSDQLWNRLKNEERKKRQAEKNGEKFEGKYQVLSTKQQQVLDNARAEGFEAGISMQVVGEMQAAKLLRAVESKRQLQEVLVDFWSNHFNLDVKKQQVRTLRLADERDAIRPHVLGRFAICWVLPLTARR
jgi:uncharacterized protein (DUF1800 family)